MRVESEEGCRRGWGGGGECKDEGVREGICRKHQQHKYINHTPTISAGNLLDIVDEDIRPAITKTFPLNSTGQLHLTVLAFVLRMLHWENNFC